MFSHAEGYYIREPEENWYIREDVAGYAYPEEGYNYRIGVTREVIQAQDDIAPLFDILNAPFDESIKRNLARVVITKALVKHPPESLRPLLATDIESVISLEDSGNLDLEDCYQIIFGRNHASRQTPREVYLSELAAAERVFSEAKMRPFSPASLNSLKEIYSFERITADNDPKLVEEYRSLAKETFSYRLEDLDVLLDEDTILTAAVIEQNGQSVLVGGAFAWRDRTYLKRNDRDVILNTYEITGTVVREEHGNQGLYKGISLVLLKLLARRPEPVDIVFGFSNIQEYAVLAVAAQMGRTLVTETAQQLHLSIKPAIQQNIVKGKYVDDIVTYIPGECLRRQY